MSLLQKTIAELRELQHEEIDLVGGGGGPTGEPTTAYTYSTLSGPNGPFTAHDDGTGDTSSDWDFGPFPYRP